MTTISYSLLAMILIIGIFASKNSSSETTPTQIGTSVEAASWLSGDHHIHSRFSVGWNMESGVPQPIIGGDAIYPTAMNALMARYHNLSWMVTTDHGGPKHSKVNLDLAYPELVRSRRVVPELLQFYGLELNTPGGDHSSIIIPHTTAEADHLLNLESQFDSREIYPADEARNHSQQMLLALKKMQSIHPSPLVFAHHPSRSATQLGEFGLHSPESLRAWNDTAPNVAVGMEGAPGHQAISLSTSKNFADTSSQRRGYYRTYPTLGGFDQMTAVLGGFWDAMLGEGRHWWITANSDSHVHYSEGGVDFWPGEYSKTYVYAQKTYPSIIESLRSGKIFVTTGDLISEIFVTARTTTNSAGIGETLFYDGVQSIELSIKVKDPEGTNFAGRLASLNHFDVIQGLISGKQQNPLNHNPSTKVIARFFADDWQVDEQGYISVSLKIPISGSTYFRIRGSNHAEFEPSQDRPGEDPWSDLWFYTNPVFLIRSEG
ncbi:MAG: phosphoesterase [Gammaproteobacteria bacterium]|jgi:hypothetical protein|nr:phosphoesterase [Gammaproteobacteria bacterium]MBT5202495.1 phosphoesterase [Gammaproteobacteria bacterium]MBT6246547.1 phosphoesterase [Gammaproteobacteria bacterium]